MATNLLIPTHGTPNLGLPRTSGSDSGSSCRKRFWPCRENTLWSIWGTTLERSRRRPKRSISPGRSWPLRPKRTNFIRYLGPFDSARFRMFACVAERHQRCAFVDLIADTVAHFLDGAIVRCDDRMLHFHGLQHQQRLASPHPVAGCRVDRDHLARHRRAQAIFVLVCLARVADRIELREAVMGAVGKDVQLLAVTDHIRAQCPITQAQAQASSPAFIDPERRLPGPARQARAFALVF